MRTDLPKYAKPPVVEVAMSVQFDELADFKLVHFGQLWNYYRERYPKTENHPPLGSVIELFGKQGPERATLSVESGYPVGRCWYKSDDALRLVQIQPDRFILNWRKLDTDVEYPSYATLRELFVKELNQFLVFVSEQELGDFTPTQCELTYVNHVPSRDGWSSRDELSNVLATWSNEPSRGFDLPPIEDLRFQWQYQFQELSKPLGRLHVHVHSAVRTSDRTPILVLQLTARGAPLGGDVGGVLAFSDRAHEWIVRAFTTVTTERMHKLWERNR